MNTVRSYSLTLLACAALTACSSLPTQNTTLDQARSDYQQAQDTPQTRDLASIELKQAGDALEQANEAARRHDTPACPGGRGPSPADHGFFSAKELQPRRPPAAQV